MIVLDSSALIALLAAEDAEPAVRAILREGDAALVSVNLAEVVDVMARRYGVEPGRTRAVLDPLLDEILAVVAPATLEGWKAGELRARHYDRASRPLSLADCILLACAGPDDAIATLDEDVLRIAELEGIETVSLHSA